MLHEAASYTLISWVHVATALLAMVLGALVLLRRKGDLLHRRLGYAYVVTMVGVNASAFGLYRLFGSFGPFHVAAIVSGLTVFAGMRAVLHKSGGPDRMVAHMIFMYWSVIGLYAAFFSEVMVRLRLGAAFATLVGVATGLTVLLGALLQPRLVRRWSRLVGKE